MVKQRKSERKEQGSSKGKTTEKQGKHKGNTREKQRTGKGKGKRMSKGKALDKQGKAIEKRWSVMESDGDHAYETKI